MAWNFTGEQIAYLKSILKQADPYDFDDPILDSLDDSSRDSERMAATTAKRWLEQDRREKEAAGIPYNDDTTE